MHRTWQGAQKRENGDLFTNESMSRTQDPNCKLAILVPIFNEDERTIARLLDSLTRQREVAPSEFEVICLVNNDLPGTRKYEEVYGANQRVLRMERLTDPGDEHRITVLDCSSPGKEIAGCNVGKARDRLVHEATKRFRGNGRNGVLSHVDADVYFNDALFLRRAIDMFDDHDVIGVAGGKWREAFLADYPEYEPEPLRAALRQIGLWKQCVELANYLNGEPVLQAFGGSNMLSRCYESVAVGGIRSLEVDEDKEFGRRMWRYAEANKRKILVKKTELKVVALLRISERTGSSFKAQVETVLRGKELVVAENGPS
ncbi:glycosyltransferase family 2 protein [Nannocystis sp. ILAH1]|uniref:glycosyltransferase n=1 Tax=Nannocystis sp. ILAH1 TaxID=2996789 RepID=UPI00226FE4D5|nr:glycosyltransferase family 2 protein [Nannocystis sp. ILAH1]MCY0991739.1 glycosyltransferase family 2 protein [Nannocystis sp. ILAH1]